jgi:hypothetical protein
MSSRAERRAHSRRMKTRAIRARGGRTEAIKEADHLASCSCWMCGNPRRYFGEPTRQELLSGQILEPE